ncbi:SMC-Scp complex subunit ScpB [Periweissella fabalis]|uniref:Segregation and condensation protein B n=1 Tax=Periweissella fabalis TaxID=1070421 RepID=A0A7X6S2Y7_9LACO|nr:SMC-Scp complex subunit ScpB [Periweissella fabalis]NKZ23616.1 SMC-Scp complex subunit ScpB [Periweissella fabalis]
MTNLAKIESLIFVAGDEGIELADLISLTNFDQTTVKEILAELALKYQADDDCSFELLQSDETFRLATKASVSKLVKHFFEAPLSTHLTQASLEVLAIIAYRQPVTRIEIDEVRGVQSSSIIQKLQLRNLITDMGRKNEPGRPIMYGTSSYFLDYFGLTSIEELPPLANATTLDEEQSLSGDLFLTAFDNRLQPDDSTMATEDVDPIPFAVEMELSTNMEKK